jgi:DNA repair protein RadD
MRLAAHKEGKLFFLCGNNVLVTGYDDPVLDLMIDLQPVMSVGRHIQKNGRIMRPSQGKTHGLSLDFGGNILRNGPIDAPFVPDKRGKSNRTGDAPVKICQFCNAYNYTIARFCVFCGGEFIFETKLTSTASTANVMLGDIPEVKAFEVDHVSYTRHEKLNMPPSIKVIYSCTLNEGHTKSHRQFSEYVCIEHPGGIAKKAQSWWMQRHVSCPPASTDAVLQRSNELKKPRIIRVHVNLKYPAILGYEF